MKCAYKFRLYPNKEQEVFFAKTFGCVRKVYNLMLADRIADYEQTKGTEAKAQYPTPAKYKKEYPYLKEVDSLALANAQLNLNRAYKNFFRKPAVGFPKWKSKHNPVQSYTTNNQRNTIELVNGKQLKLPKIGLVRVRMHRTPKGIIKSATISKEPTGKYFVSLLCEVQMEPLPKHDSVIGVDLGLKDFLILSDGSKVTNPKFLKHSINRLAKEQRRLSRMALQARKRGCSLAVSKNYQKQKLQVARQHEKIKNQRNDFLNKLSTVLIKNHDTICIEDLNVKGMVRNHKLARSIHDVSWSSFVSKLAYKAAWYGREIIQVSRWYPSSQICSGCGHISGKKPLHIRTWVCPECGYCHDRDINASRNILVEGLRQSLA